MSKVSRISISLEPALQDRLETLVEESGYTNRSEFLRDMIRDHLVEKTWRADDPVVGTITLVYDHHARELSRKLTGIQHAHHDAVLATTHVHLTHDLCAEMILVRGRAGTVRALADALRQQRGVLHAALSMSSTGADLA